MTDHYADGTYRWWHLSGPSPELVAALGDGWLPERGRAIDVGCGLGAEASHLARCGWQVTGIDLSEVALAQAVALARAAAAGGGLSFLRGDLRLLPFTDHCFDAALDRGCFHYLSPDDRPRYSAELGRVLRPDGRLLLRASLRAAGVRNDIDESVIRRTFGAWRIERMARIAAPSDTRSLDMLLVRLSTPERTPRPGRT
jgi:SAM-dependent methyltransferase